MLKANQHIIKYHSESRLKLRLLWSFTPKSTQASDRAGRKHDGVLQGADRLEADLRDGDGRLKLAKQFCRKSEKFKKGGGHFHKTSSLDMMLFIVYEMHLI